MSSERDSLSAVYELREAAVEHGKALVESRLNASPDARDQLLETALELESKTVAALDECEGD
jgi:hypothetical protein